MAFRHLNDVTTPGAADEVVDWFTTFEAWMSGLVGWTVMGGAGTQDIIFRSIGEAGGLTMLWLRVWRDAINIDRVHFELRDDLAGTHVTTNGGYVDTGGVQFEYWMTADMDAVVVVFKLAGGYRACYAGLVEPFALTIPDETYQMVVLGGAGDLFVNGTILRDAAGLWDQDNNVFDNIQFDDNRIDRFDGSFTLHGCYYDAATQIAGQLKHLSGIIEEPAINAEDTITSGMGAATSTWVILADATPNRFALRTGGVLPAGVADGNFAHVNGIAASHAALYNVLAAFAVGRGWADLGDPGIAGTSSRMLYSAGMSGVENIFVTFSVRPAVPDQFSLHVTDDALLTHDILSGHFLDALEYPINYWISGDLDCIMLVTQRAGGYCYLWGGMVSAFAPGLIAPYAGPSLTEYSIVTAVQGDVFIGGSILRQHDGTWTQGINLLSDGTPSINSNPNAFDGTTYLVWPKCAFSGIAADFEAVGQLKYNFFSSGGGIANLDTITVGAEVYTVFFDSTGVNFCMRTV